MALTRRGRLVVALLVLLLVATAVGGGGLLYLRSIGLAGSSDPSGRVDLVIPEGASTLDIGELLEGKGVIPSAWGFRLASYLDGGGGSIQAGRYELSRRLTARDALAELVKGPEVDFVEVTFPEGSWLVDFGRSLGRATSLSGKRFNELARSGAVRSKLQPPGVKTLEGLLWPATYQVIAEEDERAVLARLVGEFEERVGDLDLASARASGISAYEVVIVASMIEAEAKVDGDRAKIAAVIYNRLDQGMALGIDATIAYAVGRRSGSLTGPELDVDSPYNTRTRAGLPPTPIGAPGLKSLQAAIDPADGAWLYYVLIDCEGHHAFSTTYEEFLADKAVYRSLDC